MRRLLRLVAWNAGLALAGLVLMALAGEAWLRLTQPFRYSARPMHFVPAVGLVHEPNAEVRWTNGRDYWTVSRTNRQGFLDREPPPPDRAAASCHVTLIGDSFVDAKQVPIADKAHVQLEALAGRRLPHLDVTTSAFGVSSTGQIAQLPLYDAYARRLSAKLLVLVFVENDFWNNSPVLTALQRGWDPDRLPWASVGRGEDGALTLSPPDAGYLEHRLPFESRPATTLAYEAMLWANRRSRLAGWLMVGHWKRIHAASLPAWVRERLGILSRRPGYEWLAGEQPAMIADHRAALRKEALSPAYEEAVAFTGFALDQFKARTERDGAALAILAAHGVGQPGDRIFDRLHDLAAARGIPVISQRAWIERRGRGDVRDAHWTHDWHWSPTGHRWAAEALLEWLTRNQDICRQALPPPRRGARPPPESGLIAPGREPRTAGRGPVQPPWQKGRRSGNARLPVRPFAGIAQPSVRQAVQPNVVPELELGKACPARCARWPR